MKIMRVKMILILCISIILVACKSAIVFPKTNNTFTVFATAASKEQTIKLATVKAQNTCNVLALSMKPISATTLYQGLDKDQLQLIQTAKNVLPTSKTAGSYFPVTQKFKTTLVFECE